MDMDDWLIKQHINGESVVDCGGDDDSNGNGESDGDDDKDNDIVLDENKMRVIKNNKIIKMTE